MGAKVYLATLWIAVLLGLLSYFAFKFRVIFVKNCEILATFSPKGH